jgi:hypothetical protein
MDKALQSFLASSGVHPSPQSPPGHHLDRDAPALPTSLLATTRIVCQSPVVEDRTSLSLTYVHRQETQAHGSQEQDWYRLLAKIR